MTVARETTMSPNPARGDTTPPNKKGINPSTADALPELPRSSSRASVVLVGRIIPKHSSNTSNAPSTQNDPASGHQQHACHQTHQRKSHTAHTQATPYAAETANDETAHHDRQRIDTKTNAISQRRKSKMLLEDEWRSCNVSKHHPHGECLHKHIKHEITMCHDRTIAAEDRQQRLAMPIFRRQGLPKETQHPDQCHSQKQQHIENAAPVRHFQQHTSKHRRTNGGQSLDSTQRGKKACQFATVIKICGYGLRNDHASGSASPCNSRKKRKAPTPETSTHPSVDSKKKARETNNRRLRPYLSLSGPMKSCPTPRPIMLKVKLSWATDAVVSK